MWRVPEARSWSIAVAALALASAVSGCRSDAETQALATTRDSSGVRIVQVPDVAALPDVRAFEPQPCHKLGGLREDLREEFNPQHPFLAAVMLSDGTVLVSRAQSPYEAGYPGSRLVRMDSDVAEVLGLGIMPRSEYGLIFREVQAVASGDRYVMADGLWHELRIHGVDGRLLTIVRSDGGPRAVTNEVWDGIVEGTVPNDVTGPERSAQIAMLRSGPRSTHFPAYQAVMSGPAGQVWLQDYDYPNDPASGRNWTVFAPDGLPLGRVHLTDDTGHPAAVGADFVVLRRRNENGAAELLLHRMTL